MELTLFRIIMSLVKTDLTESCTLDNVGDDLSYKLPRKSRVVIKRSRNVSTGTKATFVPASDNCLFLNESDIYVDKAFVPPDSSAQFRFVGGLLEVNGPARVSSKGFEGHFKGDGSATWTSPAPDAPSRSFYSGEQPKTLSNGDTFNGFGRGVRQEQNVLTIEVSPEQQGLDSLRLEGGDIGLFSMPGFQIEDLFMKTKEGYSTVHDTDATSAVVESNEGTLHLKGLNAREYTAKTDSGDIFGAKGATGQGRYETCCGTIIAYAPKESVAGEGANTLEISNHLGPVILRVPEIYNGSVTASSTTGTIKVDGTPQERRFYHQVPESREVGKSAFFRLLF